MTAIGARDWRTMRRDAFDRDARETQLALDGMPAAEPCGTGDLFALLTDDTTEGMES